MKKNKLWSLPLLHQNNLPNLLLWSLQHLLKPHLWKHLLLHQSNLPSLQ